jgi:hypothetical protein
MAGPTMAHQAMEAAVAAAMEEALEVGEALAAALGAIWTQCSCAGPTSATCR